MKLYRKGNYTVEKNFYGSYDVWARKSLVKQNCETFTEAINYIKDQLK